MARGRQAGASAGLGPAAAAGPPRQAAAAAQAWRGAPAPSPAAARLRLLVLGEGVPQRDGAVEDQGARPAVRVNAEVAQALKLEAVKALAGGMAGAAKAGGRASRGTSRNRVEGRS
jgi:hypothetical protein